MKENVSAPVKAGQQVGKVVYYLEDEELVAFPVVVVEDVGRRDVSWIFDKLFQMYLGI
jgi:hypothetical protein